MSLVEIKDFNVLIDNNLFFDQPVKNNKHMKLIEMSRNDDYTTGNWLYNLHYQKYYKPIGIDLSRQTNRGIAWKIRREWCCNNVFYCWKARKNNSKFFFWYINCNKLI